MRSIATAASQQKLTVEARPRHVNERLLVAAADAAFSLAGALFRSTAYRRG